MKQPRFNLLYEPWIPVKKDRRTILVSLKEALVHAHEIEALALASPLEEAAITRLLLALLHRAFEGPQDEGELKELFEKGHFPKSPLEGYLEKWQGCFYLFHPEAPFFQVADLPNENPLPWTKLLPEFASGNNPTLFDHTFDDTPPQANFARAARALVAHQSFVPGGLLRRYEVSSAPGGPAAVAAVFIVQGSNLFETLAMNLIPYSPKGDSPLWEDGPPSYRDFVGHRTKHLRTGRTRTYTWRSRAVRLLPKDKGVTLILYGPGLYPEEKSFEPDPLFAYQANRQGYLNPVRFSEEKAFWRDFQALLPSRKEDTGRLPPKVLKIPLLLKGSPLFPLKVLGQVTDQAKVLSIRREVYPLPRRVLEEEETIEEVELVLERAEGLGSCLRRVARALAERLLSLNYNSNSKEITSLSRSLPLEATYWAELDHAFPRYLAALAENPEAAWRLWLESLEIAARQGWEATKASIGTRARNLKALSEGERSFRSCLARYVKKEA